MKKMLTALILCVTIALGSPCALAYKYTPYVGDGVICSTPVSVKIEKNEMAGGGAPVMTPAEGVADATRITASCKVKPGGEFDGAEVKVCLLIAAYHNRRLVEYSLSETVIFSSAADPAEEISAELDKTGKDADGIKVYLWDDIDNARPLFNMGEPGSGNNKIDGIIIGGETVDMDYGSKTGEVEVNAGYTKWPEVIVLTEDLATPVSVDAKGVFPLSRPGHTLLNSNAAVSGVSDVARADIKVGGDTYHISIIQTVPQITDVLFRRFVTNMAEEEPTYYTDAQVAVQYDVRNPVWTEELPGPNKENTSVGDNITKYHSGVKTLENISAAYSERTVTSAMTFFFFDIAPELLGSQYFAIPFPSISNTKTAEDCYTFTIDRSARVYTHIRNITPDPSWRRAYNGLYKTSSNLSKIMYYEFRAGDTSNSVQTGIGDNVYYKDYTVAPGTTCAISLPAGTAAPKIFVKYLDKDLAANASYTVGGITTAVETTYLYQPFYIEKDLAAEKYELYLSGTQGAHPCFGTGNLMFATAIFTEDPYLEYCPVAVPDELVGGAVLKMPFEMINATQIKFDIKASSRVYLLTNAGNQPGSVDIADVTTALGAQWQNTNFQHSDAALDGRDLAIALRSGSGSIDESVKNNSSFYRDYIISPDGRGSVVIDLPALTGETRAIVVVSPLGE